ncbi:hypothetical protein ACIPWF_10375 [Paenarthrobacter sp. NPDC089989]|uniref:hypothetical protein n=1 Tax=unclassified Paenarthrobacter TaxID=2634190 RepID=UPI0038121BB1
MEVNEADGSLVSEYPSSQAEQYSQDIAECSQKAGLDGRRDISQEEYKAVYQKVLDSVDCLEREGYDIPQAPSYQVYVQSKAQWSPFSFLPKDLTPSQFQDVVKVCPQPQLW